MIVNEAIYVIDEFTRRGLKYIQRKRSEAEEPWQRVTYDSAAAYVLSKLYANQPEDRDALMLWYESGCKDSLEKRVRR